MYQAFVVYLNHSKMSCFEDWGPSTTNVGGLIITYRNNNHLDKSPLKVTFL